MSSAKIWASMHVLNKGVYTCPQLSPSLSFIVSNFFMKKQVKIDTVLNSGMTLRNWIYIMAGHATVVVKDITLLFYHGNAVILTLW